MKRVVFTLSLFMVFVFPKAQNLVPNGSFEDTLKCTNGYGNFLGYVTSWGGGGGGLSYFTSQCAIGQQFEVPQNELGYQYAHSGVSYAGIYTYIDSLYSPSNANGRAYLQTALTTSLKASVKYYVTFFVSLADSFKYACNDIEAYLSDSALKYPPPGYSKPYIQPQIENDTSNHLTDKVNWMKVSGSFIAVGGEKYIIIGNFKDDAHSDTVFVNSSAHKENIWTAAYYFIDDVIVSADSNYADSLFTATQTINKPKEIVQIFPNPTTGIFNIQLLGVSGKSSVEVYNMLGKEVESEKLKVESTEIDLSNQPAGIYLYRIISEKGELVGSGKVIVQ